MDTHFGSHMQSVHNVVTKMVEHRWAKLVSLFLVVLIQTQSTFKWTSSNYEVNANEERKSLADVINCNKGNLQLLPTAVKVLVSQCIDSIVWRIKHKRFFK